MQDKATRIIPFDPLLPQLETVLRPERMKQELGRGNWRVAYLRYKPSTNCVILYESESEQGEKQWIYCKIFAEDRPWRPSDEDLLSYCDHRRRLALIRFPCDLQIPAIRLSHAGAAESALFARVIDPDKRPFFRASWGMWRPVRYKPERRCVLRGSYLSESAGQAQRPYFARFYARNDLPRLVKRHEYLSRAAAGLVTTPRVLGRSKKRNILLLEGLPGRSLSELISSGPDGLKALKTTAQALAGWHRLEPPPALTRRSQLEKLGSLASYLSRLVPISNVLPQNLVSVLSIMETASPRREGCLLHGDFYHDQVLIGGKGRVSFVDLDDLCLGDPEEDVANFCGHLIYLGVTGGLDRDLAFELEREFLSFYQEAAGTPLRQPLFSWHLSASLLKLAPKPFRYFLPDWPALMREVLQQAFEAIGRRRC